MELIVIGRILAGLASGLTTTIVPMYLIELAPLSLSGTMGVLCSMGVTGGVVVGQVFSLTEVFGSEELWHYALSFYAVLVLVAFLSYFWWPESPKYLYVIAGQKERAKEGERIRNGETRIGMWLLFINTAILVTVYNYNGACCCLFAQWHGIRFLVFINFLLTRLFTSSFTELVKLRCNDEEYIQYEIAEMEREMHDKQEIRTIWSVVCDPTLLLPVVLVCALQGGQQLSGSLR